MEETKFPQEEIDAFNKRHEQLVKDKKELTDAFLKFSSRYGVNIVGFNMQRAEGYCWILQDVIMDGKFFSIKSEDGSEPYPMGK